MATKIGLGPICSPSPLKEEVGLDLTERVGQLFDVSQRVFQRLSLLKSSPYVTKSICVDLGVVQVSIEEGKEEPIDLWENYLREERELIFMLENLIYFHSRQDYLAARSIFDEGEIHYEDRVREAKALMENALNGFSLVGFENWIDGFEVTSLIGRIHLECAKMHVNRRSGVDGRVFMAFQSAIQIFSDFYRNIPEENQTLKYQVISLKCEAHEFYGYALMKGGHYSDAITHFDHFLNYHYFVSRQRPDCFHYPIKVARVYESLAMACKELGDEGLFRHYYGVAQRIIRV